MLPGMSDSIEDRIVGVNDAIIYASGWLATATQRLQRLIEEVMPSDPVDPAASLPGPPPVVSERGPG